MLTLWSVGINIVQVDPRPAVAHYASSRQQPRIFEAFTIIRVIKVSSLLRCYLRPFADGFIFHGLFN